MNRLTTQFDNLTLDLGDNLTEGELYFWAGQKRAENLFHMRLGHVTKYGFCRKCGNCLCGNLNFTPLKSFRCLCIFGKVYATPYKVRKQQ